MLRFFRRQKPVHETEIQRLRDSFELSNVSIRVYKRFIVTVAVRFAWSASKGASLGRQQSTWIGCRDYKTRACRNVSQYWDNSWITPSYNNDGHKKILLKKLGSPCSFFDFVEDHELLLVVCAANKSNGLPESYHLIDTNGNEPCSTTCRSSNLPQATCFTLSSLPGRTRKCVVTG